MRNLSETLGERHALAPFAVRDISYIPELKIVMSFVSKNASSFLKTYLSCLARNKPFTVPNKNPHMPANTGFLSVEQLGHKKMSDLLTDSSVPKVLVGREPISRLLSAFASRVVTWQRERYDSHNRSEWITLRQMVLGTSARAHAVNPMTAIKEEITWSQLVDYVMETPAGELDRHLMPQTFFAGTDLISYDLLGTVENLSGFLLNLCELVGKEPLTGDDKHINSSQLRPDLPMSTLVTDEQKKALHRRYRADYDYFGFPLS